MNAEYITKNNSIILDTLKKGTTGIIRNYRIHIKNFSFSRDISVSYVIHKTDEIFPKLINSIFEKFDTDVFNDAPEELLLQIYEQDQKEESQTISLFKKNGFYSF